MIYGFYFSNIELFHIHQYNIIIDLIIKFLNLSFIETSK